MWQSHCSKESLLSPSGFIGNGHFASARLGAAAPQASQPCAQPEGSGEQGEINEIHHPLSANIKTTHLRTEWGQVSPSQSGAGHLSGQFLPLQRPVEVSHGEKCPCQPEQVHYSCWKSRTLTISIPTRYLHDTKGNHVFLPCWPSFSQAVCPQVLPSGLSTTWALCAAEQREPYDSLPREAHWGQRHIQRGGKVREKNIQHSIWTLYPLDDHWGPQIKPGPSIWVWQLAFTEGKTISSLFKTHWRRNHHPLHIIILLSSVLSHPF